MLSKKIALRLPVRRRAHKVGIDVDVTAWNRQRKTAAHILERLETQDGMILADDAGLGKTWVAALVALTIVNNNGRILILVPKKDLAAKWARDISTVAKQIGLDDFEIIRSWNRLAKKTIAIATSHEYRRAGFPRSSVDLLIVDEAHKSKGEDGKFRSALKARRKDSSSFLFLTATPFSITIQELIATIDYVSGSIDSKRNEKLQEFLSFAVNFQRNTWDGSARQGREIWLAAVKELKPWVIRHSIDSLPDRERASFGTRSEDSLGIRSVEADEKYRELLIRTGRLLSLCGHGPGVVVNGGDPRFHVGRDFFEFIFDDAFWNSQRSENVSYDLLEYRTKHESIVENIDISGDVCRVHHAKIKSLLGKIVVHPKVDAVCEAVGRIASDEREKVVVFCHHISTMHEVHRAIAAYIGKKPTLEVKGDAKKRWRQKWKHRLVGLNKEESQRVLNWVSGKAFCGQVADWFGYATAEELVELDLGSEVRRLTGAPTVFGAVSELVDRLKSAENHGGKEVFSSFFESRSVSNWQRVERPSENRDLQLQLFNTPFGPDVLIATDGMSESYDMHISCRTMIHYELDPSPIRVKQREGRIRRVKGWAQRIGRESRYAYPVFKGTRDERLVEIVRGRLERFDVLMGGAPAVEDQDYLLANQSDPADTNEGRIDLKKYLKVRGRGPLSLG